MKRELSLWQVSFFLTNLIIIIIGLFFVFSSSPMESIATTIEFSTPTVWHYILTQLSGVLVGLVLLFIGSRLPKKLYHRYALLFYIVSLVLLILTLVPGFSSAQKGGRRWLLLGPLHFQPVEIVKIAAVIFFGRLLSQSPSIWKTLFFLLPLCFLLERQPDFASCCLLFAGIMGMFFIAGGKWREILGVASVGLLLVFALIRFSPYRLERLQTYQIINQEEVDYAALPVEEREKVWHAKQLQISFGRGGLTGVGLGGSKQKFSYLPEASSDSIFAIVGEEFGFIGVLSIIALYILYFALGWRLMDLSDNHFSLKLIGYGLLMVMIFQFLIYLSAISGLIPLTGITLPFFSFGRTSLASSMLITGIILGLSRHTNFAPEVVEYPDEKDFSTRRPSHARTRSRRLR